MQRFHFLAAVELVQANRRCQPPEGVKQQICNLVDIRSHVWRSSHRLFFLKVLADNSNEIRPISNAFDLVAIPDKKVVAHVYLVVIVTPTQLLSMRRVLNIDPRKYFKREANNT